jgi:hypothetical protein
MAGSNGLEVKNFIKTAGFIFTRLLARSMRMQINCFLGTTGMNGGFENSGAIS